MPGQDGGGIYHYNGIAWQRVTEFGYIPNVGDVWGSGPNDVWFSLSDGRLLHFGTLNTPPVLTVNEIDVTVNEGTIAANGGAIGDSDGDTVALSTSVGTITNNGDGTWSWSFLTSDGPAQSQTVTIAANDGRGGIYSASFELMVNNVAPTMTLSGESSVDEGSLYSLNLSAVTDPGDDTINTCMLQWGDGQSDDCLGAIGGSLTHAYADGPNNYTISVDLTDEEGGYVNVDNLPVAVDNVAPSVVNVSVPVAPININEQTINVSAAFSDPAGFADEPYTCSIDYGDGKGSQAGTVNDATCTGYGYTYTEPGVYAVTVTISDKDGASDNETATSFIVIYDPAGGFVTGGGWIWSPAGAYIANPTLEGKATFGFVSKYLKGANVPTGNTEFQFKAGDLNFKSASYQWSVVNQNGSNAQFKGYGTINGIGNYGFMLWATDGSLDTFRIKIWDATDETIIIYDNGVGQPIGGGSIVIHTK